MSADEFAHVRINGKCWTHSPIAAETSLIGMGVLAHVAAHAVVLATDGCRVQVYGASGAVISVEGV